MPKRSDTHENSALLQASIEIKGAEAKGDSATVKVDVTISVSTALGRHNEDKTVDVQCNYVSGEWRVKPEFSQSLLGMGSSALKK